MNCMIFLFSPCARIWSEFSGARISMRLARLMMLSLLSVSRTAGFLPTSVSRASFSRLHSTSRDLEALTVPTLRTMLRERGEKVGGKKAQLIDRLLEMNADVASSSSTTASSLDNVPSFLPPSSVLIYACKS